jgi:Tol biopolymer transport system component
MERERWENLVRLHTAALEHEESQRSAFLREACAGDEDLRRELESLLAYDRKGESFLETPALQAAAKELAGEKTALAPGTHLGPYEILAPIGAGGMGEVYRAHDPRLKRDVAIKVLPAGMALDRAHIARFEREARAASALNHPNIVSVYDLGLEGQTYWIATELVVGEPLKSLIERGPLPVRKTIEIATQIAGGLSAAHVAGVVHRDLKPGNLMVTREGRVKILDFGLAKHRTGADGVPEDLTNTGTVMGTAAYMSPEQVRGEAVDHRSDIFCLGLILHEMLSGKRTFTGESSVHVMHAILTEDAPELPAGVPSGLARIVAHCLEKEAGARFQSAADIGFALGSMAGAERTATGSALPSAPPLKKEKTASRLLAGALVAVTLLLAALAFVYFRQKPGAPQVIRMSVLLPEKSRAVSLAVSPNAREIAMVLVKEGRQQIWVRPLDALEPTVLAGTDGAMDPFWSPDSRYIAFFADAKLKKIEHSGGPVQTLCDALATYGGTWNRNGEILIAGLSQVQKIPASGGTLSDLPDHAAVGDMYPVFLPGGQHYLAARGSSGSPEAGVWVIPMNGPAIRRILPDLAKTDIVEPVPGSTVGQVLFTRNGTLMALPFDMKRLEPAGDPAPIVQSIVASYPSRGNGVTLGYWLAASSPEGMLAYVSGQHRERQYVWRDRQGKILGTVPDAGNVVAISPDGKRLVGDRSDDTWVLPFGRGAGTRLMFGPGNANTVWSPDGRYIAHSMNGGIGRTPANGAGTREVVYRAKGLLFPKSWSPDGRYIICARVVPGAPADLFAVDVEHESPPIPIATTPANEDQGQFSPDGHWVAYTSNESGVSEIYVVPFPPSPSGGKWLVSRGGGVQSRWRRDGKEVFYISPDSKLMAVEVKTRPEFQSGTPQALFMTDLIDTGIRTGPASWDVGPDGRFLFITESSIDASVTVVLNWRAGIK